MKPTSISFAILFAITVTASACVVEDDQLGEDTQALEGEGETGCPLADPEGRMLSIGHTEWTIVEEPEPGEPYVVQEWPGLSMVFDPLRGTCVPADVFGTPLPSPDPVRTKKTCTWENSSDCGWAKDDKGNKTCGPTKKTTKTKEEYECGHEHAPDKTTTCSVSGTSCLQTTKTTSVCI